MGHIKVDKNDKLIAEFARIHNLIPHIDHLAAIFSATHVVEQSTITAWEKEHAMVIRELSAALSSLKQIKNPAVKHLKKHEKIPILKATFGILGGVFLAKQLQRKGALEYLKKKNLPGFRNFKKK